MEIVTRNQMYSVFQYLLSLIVCRGILPVSYGRNAIWYKKPTNSEPGGRQGNAQTEMKRGYTEEILSIWPF
jgi:hypothetical protein